ncbi:unnamed protein product [Calicophoron daubneyi]|uniref:Dynein light chain n=1 Tax=Calicophoron daubneyi TaxID=300641 RepID=A0AAV2TNS5_CALDB
MVKAVVKTTDMSVDKENEVVRLVEAVAQSKEPDCKVAEILKTQMEEKYGPTYHVIVGKNYGSKVSHEKGTFIFLYAGNKAYQIYKFG